MPWAPTATAVSDEAATERRSAVDTDGRGDQVAPSGDVRTRPVSPTATKSPLKTATPRRWAGLPALVDVQVTLSLDVAVAPANPTATKRPRPKATASNSFTSTGDRKEKPSRFARLLRTPSLPTMTT